MDIGFLAAAQSSVKLGALRAQWELKKQGKYPLSEEKGDNGLKEMREQLDRLQKDNALNLIEGKLRCGKELTAQELEYLKRERPELYEEALRLSLSAGYTENARNQQDKEGCPKSPSPQGWHA